MTISSIHNIFKSNTYPIMCYRNIYIYLNPRAIIGLSTFTLCALNLCNLSHIWMLFYRRGSVNMSIIHTCFFVYARIHLPIMLFTLKIFFPLDFHSIFLYIGFGWLKLHVNSEFFFLANKIDESKSWSGFCIRALFINNLRYSLYDKLLIIR